MSDSQLDERFDPGEFARQYLSAYERAYAAVTQPRPNSGGMGQSHTVEQRHQAADRAATEYLRRLPLKRAEL
jgi:hypothetical protein